MRRRFFWSCWSLFAVCAVCGIGFLATATHYHDRTLQLRTDAMIEDGVDSNWDVVDSFDDQASDWEHKRSWAELFQATRDDLDLPQDQLLAYLSVTYNWKTDEHLIELLELDIAQAQKEIDSAEVLHEKASFNANRSGWYYSGALQSGLAATATLLWIGLWSRQFIELACVGLIKRLVLAITPVVWFLATVVSNILFSELNTERSPVALVALHLFVLGGLFGAFALVPSMLGSNRTYLQVGTLIASAAMVFVILMPFYLPDWDSEFLATVVWNGTVIVFYFAALLVVVGKLSVSFRYWFLMGIVVLTVVFSVYDSEKTLENCLFETCSTWQEARIWLGIVMMSAWPFLFVVAVRFGQAAKSYYQEPDSSHV